MIYSSGGRPKIYSQKLHFQHVNLISLNLIQLTSNYQIFRDQTVHKLTTLTPLKIVTTKNLARQSEIRTELFVGQPLYFLNSDTGKTHFP